MICSKHNRFFPQKNCPLCAAEEQELEAAVMIAEKENSQPIVLWEGVNHE